MPFFIQSDSENFYSIHKFWKNIISYIHGYKKEQFMEDYHIYFYFILF